MMALAPAHSNPFPELSDTARAELAVALLCSLTGPAGLALIFAAMAQVDAHADDLYRLEFEKEC